LQEPLSKKRQRNTMHPLYAPPPPACETLFETMQSVTNVIGYEYPTFAMGASAQNIPAPLLSSVTEVPVE
jgi:hypothetical protein